MVEISIIVPFFNEAQLVDIFFQKVMIYLNQINYSFEILCINDGSSDNTLDKLIQIKNIHKQVKIIDFSRNFGKDAAITAGIDIAKGQCVIPMDCDLQDPPELILEMIKKWKNGANVVLAKRKNRSQDSFFKRFTAELFYKIYNIVSDFPLPENVGDFRLIDRKVVEVLKQLPERKRFMKGLFVFPGFKTEYVEYDRPKRAKGESKWSYWKLWNYAIDGITSFSIFPLKISTYFGCFITLLAFGRGIYILFRALFFGIDVPGYASLMVAMLLLGGVQLMSLGLIGEYIGRIYMESKQRPIYVINKIIE